MGELTLTTFLTLDGVMQAPGGPEEDTSGGFTQGGWLVPFFDPVMGEEMTSIFSKAAAFLLGRGTYDIFAAHWPKVSSEDDPVASSLNALPKYVASNTRSEFEWNGTSHIQDIQRDLAQLKDNISGELQVHGSHGLLQTLIERDLVDEYRLFVFPVVLGKGKRLFGSGTIPCELSHQSSKSTTTGAVINTYRRGGKIRGGSFALE